MSHMWTRTFLLAPKLTPVSALQMSAFGGKAEMPHNVCLTAFVGQRGAGSYAPLPVIIVNSSSGGSGGGGDANSGGEDKIPRLPRPPRSFVPPPPPPTHSLTT